MKKSVWIPLVVIGAVILVIGGTILTFGIINNKKLVNNEYIVDDYSNINININTADIEFVYSSDSKQKIVCQEQEKVFHNVEVKDNTLNINASDSRIWYNHLFNFSLKKMKITIYSPRQEFNDVSIISSTGNISIPSDFTFNNMDIKLSTGDTIIKSNVKETLKVDISTGDMNIESKAKKISLTSSTGDQILKNIAAEEIKLETTTGDIFLDGKADVIYTKTTTGDHLLKNIVAKEIRSESTTGDITYVECDSSSLIDVKTTTGEVNLSLLSSKMFEISTSTGKINVPSSTSNSPLCKVKTSTGNIKIDIKN